MQIPRTGTVSFGDASFSVWEDPKRENNAQWREYELLFKRQVFKRVIQQLNRMGWTVGEWDQADDYKCIANNYRTCSFGELKAQLEVSGRCIKMEMWQGVNTPTRHDHGGRYESDKEAIMPYVIRLRMERTRLILRNYLCNVFTDYTFRDRSPKATRLGPGGLTALEYINQRLRDSGHYVEALGRASIHGENDISADGIKLVHGVTRVYAFDYHGRAITGIAYFCLNGSWMIHSGKYGVSFHWHNTVYVRKPENLRVKRNDRLRRKRLEGELSKAVKTMDFLRAQTLKNILFPNPVQLYLVRNEEGLYHRTGFCGYTSDSTDAGRFTRDEIGSYANHNQLIAV